MTVPIQEGDVGMTLADLFRLRLARGYDIRRGSLILAARIAEQKKAA